jgi:hypothetical protein
MGPPSIDLRSTKSEITAGADVRLLQSADQLFFLFCLNECRHHPGARGVCLRVGLKTASLS